MASFMPGSDTSVAFSECQRKRHIVCARWEEIDEDANSQAEADGDQTESAADEI